jgi:hypothetical protein
MVYKKYITLILLILSGFIIQADDQKDIDQVANFIAQQALSLNSIKDLVKKGNIDQITAAMTQRSDFSNTQISQAISRGRARLKEIFSQTTSNLGPALIRAQNNDIDFAKAQKAYLDAIINTQWALFADAVKKGQAFTGGTIVIEDPGKRYYNFLLDYAKATNKEIANKTAKVQHVSNNPYTYMRESTHFGEFKGKPGYEQYGIEMRLMQPNKKPGSLQGALPINKVHLVFGNVTVDQNTPLTFVKWENFGLYGTAQAIDHLKQLFKNKKAGIGRREDVPDQLHKDFSALLKGISSLYPEYTQIAKNLRIVIDGASRKSRYPVNVIYNTTQAILKRLNTRLPAALAPDQKQLAAINQFKKQATALVQNIVKAGYDNLPLRRGNEVIITQQEIMA